MSRAIGALLLTLLCAGGAGVRAEARQNSRYDAAIPAAFQAAYNLDTGAALASMRRIVSAAPDDSRAHRSLAAVLWLEILFRRGAVTVDAYLGGVTHGLLSLPPPPADLDTEFRREIDRAIQLASARLARNGRDVEARYDLGSAYGLQASYLASVNGTTGSALMAARRAFDAQETVLQQAPQLTGAGLVVGTYRYLVASLNLPARMFAYVVGFGGDKALGIKLLQAAAHDPGTHVEAKTALVLIYSREGRHEDAFRLLGELAAEFPRNRLFVLEQGAAAIRARRLTEADTLLTRGLEGLDADTRPKIPGERALWLYKRGQARLAANRRVEAAADLRRALSDQPVEWVRGRITIELGKIADLAGNRTEAVSLYQAARTIAGTIKDPLVQGEAARLIKQPWAVPTLRPH
jgi:hypothetical protein